MTEIHSLYDVSNVGTTALNVVFHTAFGNDEFGRNHIVALLQAMALSFARGIYMAALLLLVSGALAIFMQLQRSKVVVGVLQIVVDALESVPIYLWVLGGVSWAPQYRATVTTCIFVLAGLPLLYNSLRGVIVQIMQQPYYQAAIALGANKWQLTRNHIVPNLLPHALPIIPYITGVAIAIYGGIGIFGFINRSELDLGVFLLRGKEQAGFDLTILVLTLGSYIIVFLLLQGLSKKMQKLTARTSDVRSEGSIVR